MLFTLRLKLILLKVVYLLRTCRSIQNREIAHFSNVCKDLKLHGTAFAHYYVYYHTATLHTEYGSRVVFFLICFTSHTLIMSIYFWVH
jgi:hypothetical protein